MANLDSRLSELNLDVQEVKEMLDIAKRPKVKDLLTISLRKLETEVTNLKEQQSKESEARVSENGKAAALKEVSNNMSKRQHKQLKDYSWDQSDKFVKVYLTNLPGLAALNKENIQLEFTDQSLSVRVEDLGGKDLSFAIKQTAYPIDPASSHYKVKSDYLLIFMAKAKQGNKWSHITHAEKVAADSKSKAMDPKPDASKDPSAGLMDMMKKMYEEGDDEMKRTIAKAWTEGQDKKGMGGMGGLGDL